jgi:hypothetical protein
MSQTAAPEPTEEYSVSTRLVRLDGGLFTLSVVPATTPNVARCGVRVCPPPGPAARAERIAISGFRPDGWLTPADEPLLIRIAPGGAEVLFTMYWAAADGAGNAPGLRLARFTPDQPFPAGAPAQAVPPARAGAGMPVPPPVRTPPAATPARSADAEIVAHVQDVGDVEGRLGDWIGRRGTGSWIEGFSLTPRDVPRPEDLELRAVLGRDWLAPWLPGGSYCGSRGLALPLRGFCVRLKGEAATRVELAIFARFVDGTEVGPMGSDQIVAAPGFAALEAFRIVARRRPG